ncbi:hypothetical protein FA95DRAFT_1599635 [Auriscalpium vulgare]|uniref:Uncharacterized protein n=1 Tax=Auriscalpium vulgare TaxID=40419 RepID=A0ACB8R737_9AGAM|nr:hypothetical protein FA95DRAFT_1599635 [Auriscalpium vulgare]
MTKSTSNTRHTAYNESQWSKGLMLPIPCIERPRCRKSQYYPDLRLAPESKQWDALDQVRQMVAFGAPVGDRALTAVFQHKGVFRRGADGASARRDKDELTDRGVLGSRILGKTLAEGTQSIVWRPVRLHMGMAPGHDCEAEAVLVLTLYQHRPMNSSSQFFMKEA